MLTKIMVVALAIMLLVPFAYLPTVNAQGTPTLYLWVNNDTLESLIASYLGINVKNAYDKPFENYNTNYLLGTTGNQFWRDNNTSLPLISGSQHYYYLNADGTNSITWELLGGIHTESNTNVKINTANTGGTYRYILSALSYSNSGSLPSTTLTVTNGTVFSTATNLITNNVLVISGYTSCSPNCSSGSGYLQFTYANNLPTISSSSYFEDDPYNALSFVSVTQPTSTTVRVNLSFPSASHSAPARFVVFIYFSSYVSDLCPTSTSSSTPAGWSIGSGVCSSVVAPFVNFLNNPSFSASTSTGGTHAIVINSSCYNYGFGVNSLSLNCNIGNYGAGVIKFFYFGSNSQTITINSNGASYLTTLTSSNLHLGHAVWYIDGNLNGNQVDISIPSGWTNVKVHNPSYFKVNGSVFRNISQPSVPTGAVLTAMVALTNYLFNKGVMQYDTTSNRLYIFNRASFLVYNLSNPSTSTIYLGNVLKNDGVTIISVGGQYNLSNGNTSSISGEGYSQLSTTSSSTDFKPPSSSVFIYNTNMYLGNLHRGNTTEYLINHSSNKIVRIQTCYTMPTWFTSSRLYDFGNKLTTNLQLFNTGSNQNGYSWTNCLPSFMWFGSGLAPHADAGVISGQPKTWIEYRQNTSQTRYHLISPAEYVDSVNVGRDLATLFPKDTSPNEYNYTLNVYIPRTWSGHWLRLFVTDTSVSPSRFVSVVYGTTNQSTPFQVPLLNLACVNLKIYDTTNYLKKNVDVCGQTSLNLEEFGTINFRNYDLIVQNEQYDSPAKLRLKFRITPDSFVTSATLLINIYNASGSQLFNTTINVNKDNYTNVDTNLTWNDNYLIYLTDNTNNYTRSFWHYGKTGGTTIGSWLDSIASVFGLFFGHEGGQPRFWYGVLLIAGMLIAIDAIRASYVGSILAGVWIAIWIIHKLPTQLQEYMPLVIMLLVAVFLHWWRRT